jgi:hypothetical protein
MPEQNVSVFDPRHLRHATKLAFSMEDLTLDNLKGFASEVGTGARRWADNASTKLERALSSFAGRDVDGDNMTNVQRGLARAASRRGAAFVANRDKQRYARHRGARGALRQMSEGYVPRKADTFRPRPAGPGVLGGYGPSKIDIQRLLGQQL